MLLARRLGVWDWWNQVDEHVWIGAFPLHADVAKMKALGLRGIVNTCLERRGPESLYLANGMEELRIPTIDYTPPTLDDLQRAVAFIRRHAEKGEHVYVHCKAGRARSATVVICWLMDEHGVDPLQAQRWLLEKRKQAHQHIYQRKVVQDYWAKLQSEQEPA